MKTKKGNKKWKEKKQIGFICLFYWKKKWLIGFEKYDIWAFALEDLIAAQVSGNSSLKMKVQFTIMVRK